MAVTKLKRIRFLINLFFGSLFVYFLLNAFYGAYMDFPVTPSNLILGVEVGSSSIQTAVLNHLISVVVFIFITIAPTSYFWFKLNDFFTLGLDSLKQNKGL